MNLRSVELIRGYQNEFDLRLASSPRRIYLESVYSPIRANPEQGEFVRIAANLFDGKLLLTTLIFVLLLFPSVCRAEEPPPAPMSLWRDVVRAYDKGVREEDPDARRVAEDGFQKIKSVRTDSGEIVAPDASNALARLKRLSERDQEPSRDDRLHAAAMKALAELKLGTGGSDPGADAKKILASEEFKDAAEGKSGRSPLEKWIAERMQRFGEWINKAFGRVPRGDGSGLEAFALTMRLFLYFLGTVLAIVIGWQVFKLAREGGWIKSKKKKIDPIKDGDLLAEDIADPLADASTAEERGELREAVRLVYIATLRLLRERGWIALEANRTNWEYQRLLARRSRNLASLLRPATAAFDRVWYGGRNTTSDDLQTVRECYRALSEAAE